VSGLLRSCRSRGRLKAVGKTFAAVNAGQPTAELLAYQYLQALVAVHADDGRATTSLSKSIVSAD
jgi:hypothetical protein